MATFIGRRQNPKDHVILSNSLRNGKDMFNTLQSKLSAIVSQIEENYSQNHHNRYALRGIIMGILLTDKEFAYADVIEVFPLPDTQSNDV